jgi:hypothetical protein
MHPMGEPVLAKQKEPKTTPALPEETIVILSFILKSGITWPFAFAVIATDDSAILIDANKIVDFLII